MHPIVRDEIYRSATKAFATYARNRGQVDWK
jgi:hypothetical protein